MGVSLTPLSLWHRGYTDPLQYRKYKPKIASNPVGSMQIFPVGHILRYLDSMLSGPLHVLVGFFLVSTSPRYLVSWMWVIRFYVDVGIIDLKNRPDRTSPTWNNLTLCQFVYLHLYPPSQPANDLLSSLARPRSTRRYRGSYASRVLSRSACCNSTSRSYRQKKDNHNSWFDLGGRIDSPMRIRGTSLSASYGSYTKQYYLFVF